MTFVTIVAEMLSENLVYSHNAKKWEVQLQCHFTEALSKLPKFPHTVKS